MPRIETSIVILAQIERVFDLARSIDVHVESQARHREQAVAGRTSGLIELDEHVTWRATHFGRTMHLTSKITQYNRPQHFRDSMVDGPFLRFDHDHLFVEEVDGVRMTDIFDYESPYGILGRLADQLFLKRHMARLLEERAEVLRQLLESGNWKKYLPE